MKCLHCNGMGYVENVFVKSDLSQAEIRVVAELLLRDAKDSTLHDLYKNPNFDIHTWMSAKVYSISEDMVDRHQRDIGKLVNHSGNYGAGPHVLVAKALKDGIDGVDYNLAQKLIVIRHKAIPGLRKWWKHVEKQITTARMLTTCLGRRRIFFGRLDEATFRDAYAFEPQSTVADVCNTIFRRLDSTLNKDCHLILQVHDEVVIECPKRHTEHVIEAMKKAAIVPLHINKQPLIIPLDISVGPNWRDCK